LSWAFPSDGAPQGPLTLHATTVAVAGRGLLILGPSGSGKSALALDLMALGACLVADDRTIVTRAGDTLVATCPPAIRGLIEARGIGILNATPCDSAPLALAVDLGHTETERLPPPRKIDLLDRPLPLLHKVATGYFAAGLLQYLKAGLAER
jgi:HPr kinase/phosphorylase